MGGRRRLLNPALVFLGLGLALFAFSKSRYAFWPFGPKWVRIVRSGGEPVQGALVALARPGESELDFARRTPSNSGWLDIPREKIRRGQEMLVIAPGCGIVRGRLPVLYEVELPPAVPVTLRLEGGFALPRPPESICVDVEAVGVRASLAVAFQTAVVSADYWLPGLMERIPPGSFDVDPETRTVDLLFPCPGLWHLRWAVVLTETRGGGTQRSGNGSSDVIGLEVPEGGGTLSFSIDPREIERLRRR